MMIRQLLLPIVFVVTAAMAQPCMVSYNYTAAPPPVGGVYQGGQTVSFCFTVTFWNSTNANWFHGLVPSFGPGWDLTTLVPGPPPVTCGGSGGTWGWYPVCTGTSFTAIGPVGPGYFFDLNNDGNPGNNFGDFCTGAVNWQFCWDITVADGVNCIPGADLSVTVNTYGDSETGSWGSTGCTGDAVVPSAAATNDCCLVDAGTDGMITVCDNGVAFSLFTLLGGTPDAGGVWTDPNGIAHSGMFIPGTSVGGTYIYDVLGPGGNCSDQSEVDVTVNAEPVAGVPASTTVCSNGAVVDLFTLLGPTAQAGGSWSGPSVLTGSTFDPSTNAAGAYTYTVAGMPPCVDASATVTVNMTTAADAGTHGNISLCDLQAPVDLFLSLGGSPDAGGSWIGPGPTPGGMFDPGAGIPGVYTYTVLGTAPCPDASANVTVTVSSAADAGTDAVVQYCDAQASVDLFTVLGGSPDVGGSWTDPNGVAFAQPLDPGLDPPGIYTYTVIGTAPCASDVSTVDVAITQQAFPGNSGSTTICVNDPTFLLISVLTGGPGPGGVWTDPGGLVTSATFTPGTSAPGNYTYTFPPNGPCPSVMATATIMVDAAPNAGANASVNVCSNDGPMNMFLQLGGTPQAGGIWTDPNAIVTTANFTPGTSVDGVYTYTVSGSISCPSSSATVTMTTITAPFAGTGGAVTLCDAGGPYALFGHLTNSPDPGGSWTDPNAVAMSGSFDPAIHAAGVYTYTVSGAAPCSAASSALVVTLAAQPDAGVDAATTFCSSGPPAALLQYLGGSPDPGGSWTDPNNAPFTGPFDPALHTAGAYTYSLSAPAPCIAASAELTITISQAVQNGQMAQLDLCSTDTPTDLTAALVGVPSGGTWTDPNAVSISSMIDPATALQGVYSYSIPAPAPCPAGVHTVDVSIQAAPNAGTDAMLDLCIESPAQSLFPLLGAGANGGGTWTGSNGSAFTGVFDPATDAIGDHLYVVDGIGACSLLADTAIVIVGLLQADMVDVSSTPATGCVPLTTQFTPSNVANVAQLSWDFGDGASGNGLAPVHVYGTVGTFVVSVTVTDNNGCTTTGSLPDQVVVQPTPTAEFTYSPFELDTEDPNLILNTASSSQGTIMWTIDGVEAGDLAHFTHTFIPALIGMHDICLTVTTANGCASEHCERVLIDDALTVHVPNAFTPDADGLNDGFLPIILGNDPEDHHLMVFDRWGAVVFETHDATLPWNGALQNSGEILPQGVYAWRMLYRDRFSAERRLSMGHVTLLK